MDFLNDVLYGISLRSWFIALGIAVGIFLFLQFIKFVIPRRVEKWITQTETEIDDLVAHLLSRTHFLFSLAVSLYFGSLSLNLADKATKIIGIVVMTVVLLQVGVWATATVAHIIKKRVKEELERDKDAASATTIQAMGVVIKIALWILIGLLVLDNAGVKVNSLIASLGIGGIAVALAVQNVLGDLFASMSIAFDKPFVIGDFIIIDDYMGTVEHIGLKSTRLRSLSGEQLVFANSDLLNSRIRNFKRMADRRISFSIGVTYDTPHEKVAAIPDMIREAIQAHDKTNFDRCHFSEYEDSALKFDTVYYVNDPDYNVYMDIQQDINLSLLRRFEERASNSPTRPARSSSSKKNSKQ